MTFRYSIILLCLFFAPFVWLTNYVPETTPNNVDELQTAEDFQRSIDEILLGVKELTK